MRLDKIFFVSASTLLIFSSFANASMIHEDITGRWGVGVQVSGALPTDDSDPATQIGGSVIYGIVDYFAVGMEVGWMSFDQDSGSIDLGDLEGVPVFGILQARYPFAAGGTNATVYGTFGLGGIFWDYNESDLLNRNSINVDVENSLAVKLGLGVDLFINRNWVVSAEGSYVFSNSKTTISAPGLVAAEDVDTDYWTIGGGAKYYFQ